MHPVRRLDAPAQRIEDRAQRLHLSPRRAVDVREDHDVRGALAVRADVAVTEALEEGPLLPVRSVGAQRAGGEPPGHVHVRGDVEHHRWTPQRRGERGEHRVFTRAGGPPNPDGLGVARSDADRDAPHRVRELAELRHRVPRREGQTGGRRYVERDRQFDPGEPGDRSARRIERPPALSLRSGFEGRFEGGGAELPLVLLLAEPVGLREVRGEVVRGKAADRALHHRHRCRPFVGPHWPSVVVAMSERYAPSRPLTQREGGV